MLTSGSRLGHFEIGSPLGAGGMGEVYRARDERLDRDVAIKVVPAEVADDPERRGRFEREARALAKLSHPNILRIFELGEHDRTSFVVTELLEGETLRARIDRGALPWRKAAGIAADIADGLAAAHEAGIVHRDLKPANVFLTEDGRVKVLDFGLAKVDEGPVADLDTVTSPSPGTAEGTVMGTVGYMAPEQVRGEPADARTDVFALGCVLYEMLSGSSPFKRDTPMETMAAVLKDEPPELSGPGIGGAPELERIIERCLEKSPARRFQAAADLAFDLRSLVTSPGRTVGRGGGRRRTWIWAGPAVLVLLGVVVATLALAPWGGERPEEPVAADRVLVLPFDNRTGDAVLDPLSRMASDWITQGIARAEGIEAVPSTSVLVAQNTTGDAAVGSLAEKTRAGLVVSGAYYRQGEELQLQATITDVAEDTIVAAVEPVRGNVQAPMDAIDTVRRRVLGALALRVGSLHEIPYGLLRRAPLYQAYREFILGFELFLTDDRAALEHFERAAEIDPEFHTPLLYASYILYEAGRYEKAGRMLREVRDERDSFTPFGRRWIDALSAYTEHRYGEALRHLLEAELHAPRDPMTVQWIVFMCVATNQPHRALEWIATYPEQPWGNHLMGNSWTSLHGRALHAAGEHERELRMARQTLDEHPEWSAPRRHQVAALAALGRIEELAAAVEVGLTRPETADLGGWILLRGARELRAHGHRDASLDFAARAVAWCEDRPSRCRSTDDDVGLLVHALRYAERWDEAAARLGAAVGSESSRPGVIGVRGCLAARLGDSAAALDASEALGRLDDPHLFGRQTYWRACIAAVLGERDRAVALLERAIAEGLGYGSSLHTQIALESVWDEPAFQKLLSPAE